MISWAPAPWRSWCSTGTARAEPSARGSRGTTPGARPSWSSGRGSSPSGFSRRVSSPRCSASARPGSSPSSCRHNSHVSQRSPLKLNLTISSRTWHMCDVPVLVAGNGVYLAEGNHVISDDAEGGGHQESLWSFILSNYSLQFWTPLISKNCFCLYQQRLELWPPCSGASSTTGIDFKSLVLRFLQDWVLILSGVRQN